MPATLELRRLTLDSNVDCASCGCPLFVGEVAWNHDKTWSIGCSESCCREAAIQKLAMFGEPTAEPLRKETQS